MINCGRSQSPRILMSLLSGALLPFTLSTVHIGVIKLQDVYNIILTIDAYLQTGDSSDLL